MGKCSSCVYEELWDLHSVLYIYILYIVYLSSMDVIRVSIFVGFQQKEEKKRVTVDV